MFPIDPKGEVLARTHIDLRGTETEYNVEIPSKVVRSIKLRSSSRNRKKERKKRREEVPKERLLRKKAMAVMCF